MEQNVFNFPLSTSLPRRIFALRGKAVRFPGLGHDAAGLIRLFHQLTPAPNLPTAGAGQPMFKSTASALNA